MNRSFSVFLSLAVSVSFLAAQGIPEGYVGKPYKGKPYVIPGTIQAERYDIAPKSENGITFHYNGEPRDTPWRLTSDSIGLGGFGEGHVSTDGKPEAPDQMYAGWTQTGQWMKYTVQVAEAGTYVVGGKFAAGGKDARISVTFNPQIATGPIAIPTTAGFQPGVEVFHVWETLDNLAEVTLPAGIYVMTLKIEEAGGMNIDYLTFTKKP